MASAFVTMMYRMTGKTNTNMLFEAGETSAVVVGSVPDMQTIAQRALGLVFSDGVSVTLADVATLSDLVTIGLVEPLVALRITPPAPRK